VKLVLTAIVSRREWVSSFKSSRRSIGAHDPYKAPVTFTDFKTFKLYMYR
jgi:hypothetical protein